ncbi:MAG: hypothetical protein QOD00_2145 [Blastocatellia bacterium]|nr:hypothetical protein [Blastocatellia bacterium]
MRDELFNMNSISFILPPSDFQLALVGLALILIIAKLCGAFFEKLGQPAVLGELVGGMLVGNLALAGFNGLEFLKSSDVIAAFAELGVIILLFEVGLESNLGEMLEVGWSSLLVALAGVVVPFFLGWGVSAYFTPGESRLAHLFIGATLCATSVGITARVLKDTGRLKTREARVILGAAVIDDVLGLLILAVVAGVIKAAATGATLSLAGFVWIAAKAVLFLIFALLVGRYLTPTIFRGAGHLETRGMLLALSIAFCFLLAWVAALVGLAPIVGAFAAGLVLDDLHFLTFPVRDKRDLLHLLSPVSTLAVPIFFVLMGLRVDLRVFANLGLLGFALVLTLAAIVGKQVCSLAVAERGLNRLAVGLGMIPRGEVGLIFAGLGATLMLPDASGVSQPVIGAQVYGAILIMVILTTLVTPPALKWSLSRASLSSDDAKATLAASELGEDAAGRISQ